MARTEVKSRSLFLSLLSLYSMRSSFWSCRHSRQISSSFPRNQQLWDSCSPKPVLSLDHLSAYNRGYRAKYPIQHKSSSEQNFWSLNSPSFATNSPPSTLPSPHSPSHSSPKPSQSLLSLGNFRSSMGSTTKSALVVRFNGQANRPDSASRRSVAFGPDLKLFADTRGKRVPVSLSDPGKSGKQTNHTCDFGLLTADN